MNTTLVTGIWDLNRSDLTEGWARGFDHYINNFKNLLTANLKTPMVIFIDPSLESIVWKIREKSNTQIVHHKKSDFGDSFFPFFDKVQEIRTNEKWLSQVSWLRDSTQARLDYYNPLVMSKMFLLHNAKIFNFFNTDYLFWIDGGITNTVHPGYFSHDNVIEKLENTINKFLFICFPYTTETEIHGFDINGMKKYCQTDNVTRVARGGFFGGHISEISKANDLYYTLLKDSLSEGFMGTEESIFTIMTYLDPDTYQFEMIEDNGLISTFFEKIKNTETKIQATPIKKLHKNNDILVYINTFNTPAQLELLCCSFLQYAPKFLNNSKVILINNSSEEFDDEYDTIFTKYSFYQHIKKGNLGVCGARQFAAEHFANTESKYMFFFEDDMLVDLSDIKCDFGFSKSCPDFYDTVIKIMDMENYDFLKLTFSEFYGHNGDQWAWHNVPQNKREEYFGDIKKKPLTKFKHIKTFNKTPYAEGEIYYSNWPQIVGQVGNKKMFLDTKWQYPYEQTWMSHMFTLTKENKLNPALLLLSPITHNRVFFYGKDDRREN